MNFEGAFTVFHGLFFAPGTWEFPSNSLLIEVFPAGFWVSAGALWGGFLSASVAFPTRGAWVPFGVAGLDVHAQPVTFTYANQPVLGLNAVCPWIGFGLAWRGRRA